MSEKYVNSVTENWIILSFLIHNFLIKLKKYWQKNVLKIQKKPQTFIAMLVIQQTIDTEQKQQWWTRLKKKWKVCCEDNFNKVPKISWFTRINNVDSSLRIPNTHSFLPSTHNLLCLLEICCHNMPFSSLLLHLFTATCKSIGIQYASRDDACKHWKFSIPLACQKF